MTPPIIWYTDHDGIAVPTDSPPPGAVRTWRWLMEAGLLAPTGAKAVDVVR